VEESDGKQLVFAPASSSSSASSRGGMEKPFLSLSLSLSISLSLSLSRAPAHSHLLFSLEPPFHTLQGLHSGSDKKYDALIIDEDKVRF